MPDTDPMPKEGLSAEETRATLGVFLQLWDHTADGEPLRRELARRIEQVAKSAPGQPDAETTKALEGLAAKLKDQNAYSAAGDAVRRAIGR